MRGSHSGVNVGPILPKVEGTVEVDVLVVDLHEPVVVVHSHLVIQGVDVDEGAGSPGDREPEPQLVGGSESAVPLEPVGDLGVPSLGGGQPDIDCEVVLVAEIRSEGSGGEPVEAGPVFGVNRGRRGVEHVVVESGWGFCGCVSHILKYLLIQ